MIGFNDFLGYVLNFVNYFIAAFQWAIGMVKHALLDRWFLVASLCTLAYTVVHWLLAFLINTLVNLVTAYGGMVTLMQGMSTPDMPSVGLLQMCENIWYYCAMDAFVTNFILVVSMYSSVWVYRAAKSYLPSAAT
jgi:hypothetical protein